MVSETPSSPPRSLGRWFLPWLILSVACVDLTAPWEKRRDGAAGDAPAGSGGNLDLPDGAGAGGATDLPHADGATGGTGGARDAAGGAGGSGGLDASVIDVPLPADVATGGAGGNALDGPVADSGRDLPLTGTGGSGPIDAAKEAGTGGISGTGGAGGTTGKGGTGGTTAKGGTGGGGTTASGGSTGTGGATSTGGACAAYTPGAGTGGLVAYYACDLSNGTTLADASGNKKDGTLAADGTPPDGGTSYAYGTGKAGSAVYFTAASKAYASLPARLLLNACEATIAAWVYLNTSTEWQRIFDFGKPETTPKIYMFLTSRTGVGNKTMRFAISINGNVSGAEQTIDATAELPAGAWHHVAVVLGAAGGILYLDGAQAGANSSLTLRPADLGNIADYFIGKSHYPDPYLDGAVDELRIYNRALSATEIAALATP
jgi:hypothetical protein